MRNIHQKASVLLNLAALIPKIGSGRIVASIFHKSRLVSMGFCSKSSLLLQRQFGNVHQIYNHAEIHAIHNAMKTSTPLNRAEMLIVRAKFIDGKLVYGLAKPCQSCQSAIDVFEIKRVYFSTNDQEISSL